MSTIVDPLTDERVQAAIAEVQDLIRARYPSATFSVWVGLGDDPDGIYIEAAIDTDDLSEVVETYSDRLVDLHVDDGLPIRVISVNSSAAGDSRSGRNGGYPRT